MNNASTGNRHYYLLLFLLLFLTIIPVLLFMFTARIQIWDEARQAVNAAEMFVNGNWLVTHYRNQPDMWNTKPPLLIWLQVAGMRVLGVTELAVRLPSALASLLTVALVFWFGSRKLGSTEAGALGALVLICSRGFMTSHVALTGDYDALLTFWITLYALFFFLYLDQPKLKYLLLIVLGLTGAALTKSMAALLPAPGLLLYTLLRGRLLPLLRNRELYAGAAFFVLVVLSYYFLREQQNPGYMQAVHQNELGGRFMETLESHRKVWYYYFLGGKFMPWLLLLPLSIWLIYRQQQEHLKRYALFAVCFYAAFLFIISASKTKLPWYDAPLYPVTSLLVGIGLHQLFLLLMKRFHIRSRSRFIVIASVLLFLAPYAGIMAKILKQPAQDIRDARLAYGYFLNRLQEQHPALRNFTIISEDVYNAPLEFYLLSLRQKGYLVNEQKTNGSLHDDLNPGQTVLTCDSALHRELSRLYEAEVVYTADGCAAARIIRKK